MVDPGADLLRRQILKVVDTQLQNDDPPDTRSTLERLMKEGHSKRDAKRMIGCVVVAEMFEIARHGRTYDHDSFLAALAALPELPE